MTDEMVRKYFELEDMDAPNAIPISQLQRVSTLEIYHYRGMFLSHPKEVNTFRLRKQLHFSMLRFLQEQ